MIIDVFNRNSKQDKQISIITIAYSVLCNMAWRNYCKIGYLAYK